MPSIPGQVLLWLQTSCTYCLPSSNSGQAGALLWRSALQFSKVHNGSQPCLLWASLEAVLGAPSSSKPVTPPTTLKVQLFPSQSSSWLPWSKWWQDCQQLQSLFSCSLSTQRDFSHLLLRETPALPTSSWFSSSAPCFSTGFRQPSLLRIWSPQAKCCALMPEGLTQLLQETTSALQSPARTGLRLPVPVMAATVTQKQLKTKGQGRLPCFPLSYQHSVPSFPLWVWMEISLCPSGSLFWNHCSCPMQPDSIQTLQCLAVTSP